MAVERFGAWLGTAEGMERNYGELVLLLYDRGKTLGPDQCFAFVPPPVFAPDIDIDAIVAQSIGVITMLMAQMFQKTQVPQNR